MIKTVANILWLIFGGIEAALAWAALGIMLCITVVGIPFGLQCFKVAYLSFFPFGKKVVLHFGHHPVANTLWAVFFGWIIAFIYLIFGIVQMLTVVGIASGLRSFKLMKLALFPFGATITK